MTQVQSNRFKKLVRKSLVLIVSLFALLFVVLVSVSLLVGYKVTHPSIKGIDKTPSDYKLTYEDVKFMNKKDDIQLKGWWIPTQLPSIDYPSKTIIFSHGYGYNRQKMPFDSLKLAKKLSEEGYNILMFDFRNSGESQKGMTTFGYNEKNDLLSAVSFVSKMKNSKEVVLMGWSMGGATSILAGAEADEVTAVIADSPFADLEEYSSESFSYWTGLPPIVAALITRTTEFFYPELRTTEVKPYLAARNFDNKGLFLIHGKEDGAIPYKQSQQIHNSLPKSQIWLPKEGGHIRTYKYNEEQYEEKVIDFLKEQTQSIPMSHYITI